MEKPVFCKLQSMRKLNQSVMIPLLITLPSLPVDNYMAKTAVLSTSDKDKHVLKEPPTSGLMMLPVKETKQL